MKRNELLATILKDLGNRTDLTADASQALSLAVSHYNRERFYFQEDDDTFSASASLAYYAMPSNLGGKIDEILISVSGRKSALNRVEFSEIDEKDDGVSTGQPAEWCIYQNQVRLWPLPDAAYTLTRSYASTTADASASGSNVWTTAGVDLLRYRVDADLWLSMGNIQMAQMAKNREMEAYNSLIAATTRRISTGKLKKSGW